MYEVSLIVVTVVLYFKALVLPSGFSAMLHKLGSLRGETHHIHDQVIRLQNKYCQFHFLG